MPKSINCCYYSKICTSIFIIFVAFLFFSFSLRPSLYLSLPIFFYDHNNDKSHICKFIYCYLHFQLFFQCTPSALQWVSLSLSSPCPHRLLSFLLLLRDYHYYYSSTFIMIITIAIASLSLSSSSLSLLFLSCLHHHDHHYHYYCIIVVLITIAPISLSLLSLLSVLMFLSLLLLWVIFSK